MDYVSERIRKLSPYLAGEQTKYRIKLNTNENAYPPTPKIVELLKGIDIDTLKRYPSPDCNTLSEAIANKYRINPDMVFVGNGSDEILAFTHMAFFDGEDEAIAYPDVTYSFYPVYNEIFKIKSYTIPLREDYTIDLTQYDNLNVKGYIFANPNAPTSIALSRDEIESFVRRNPDKLIIIDEAYADFSNESVIDLIKTYDNLLVIETFSKGYALAGIRCGYAIGNATLIEGIKTVKDCFNNYPVDYITEQIAITALNDEEYYKDINLKVIATRARISEALKERGFTVLESGTNFIFASPSGNNANELYSELKDRGILVRYWNKPRINNFLRITIGTDSEMDLFLRELDEIMDVK